ncbi:MAG TPA: SPOR domain-containing protein [Candidatus Saccharimonadales bacterium]|nr:SPOR domain-containing protein [Candidatus Saccharimonadales bacterium]
MSDVEGNDTEITLGVGKLLGLFFGLVILCGISLSVGYTLGRNSAKQAIAATETANTTAPATPTPSTSKPGASQVAAPKAQDCSVPGAGDNCPPQQTSEPSTSDLTFYQSVQQKEAHPQLAPPAAAPNPAAHPAEVRTTLGTGYLVQIAAVRNQDDARLLSNALQKQQFPVIIAQPGDKLFHVQVGPYADIKDAEAIRSRLVSAGYNAFLKR